MSYTQDVFIRLTVRRTLAGPVTPDKKHKAVRTTRHAFDRLPGYTVVSAEVAQVRDPEPHNGRAA